LRDRRPETVAAGGETAERETARRKKAVSRQMGAGMKVVGAGRRVALLLFGILGLRRRLGVVVVVRFGCGGFAVGGGGGLRGGFGRGVGVCGAAMYGT